MIDRSRTDKRNQEARRFLHAPDGISLSCPSTVEGSTGRQTTRGILLVQGSNFWRTFSALPVRSTSSDRSHHQMIAIVLHMLSLTWLCIAPVGNLTYLREIGRYRLAPEMSPLFLQYAKAILVERLVMSGLILRRRYHVSSANQ